MTQSKLLELNHDTLCELVDHRAETCVSVFVPFEADKSPATVATRLHNLLRDVDEELEGRGANGLGERLQTFVRDGELDVARGGSVALFADPEAIRYTYLPWLTKPQCSVSDRFAVRPLTPASVDDEVIVVALSQGAARALRVDRSGVQRLDIPDLPGGGVDDVPGADAEHNELQFHSGGKGARGESTAIYHGHRDDTKVEDELVARLCRETARAMAAALESRKVPVVVAAVETLGKAFREHAKQLDVIDVIAGNAEAVSDKELAKAAREALEAHRSRCAAGASERVTTAIHHGKGSTKTKEIVIAAADGLVDTLYVNAASQVWGNLDRGRREVTFAAEAPEADDLIDLAIAETIRHGGEVVPELPDGLGDGESAMAALYRHAVNS